MTIFQKQDIEQNIPQVFERIVSKYGNKIAVKTPEQSITYYELNCKANAIANSILSESKIRQKPILLLFESEIDVFTSIFGVLKTNNISVVLDSSLPQLMLEQIRDDSQAKMIITNSKYLELACHLCSNSEPIKIINIDLLDAQLFEENLNLKINSSHIATIFYTSGSTGKPKGIFCTHQAILHRVWLDVKEGLRNLEYRHLSLYSPNFAAGNADVFGTLLNGMTLFFYDAKKFSLNLLLKFIETEKITILRFPVAIFRQFLSELPAQIKLDYIRFIYLAGDKIYRKDIERIRAIFSAKCVVIYRYSSSETTVITQFLINHQTEINSELVSTGKIVADKQVLIVDENRQELGYNKVGEIAVKSRYLSSGYWRNPQLTKQKYLVIKNEEKTRICFTGDLGKIDANGFLVHLGRQDFMVKIRGYRVEISQIEAILYSLDEVRDVIVTTRLLKGEENQSLIAYIILQNNLDPKVSYFRKILLEKLPDYMIPSAFVFLDSFPLTPNGKIDRKVLPEPNFTANKEEEFIAPRNEIEIKLANIWEEVLGIKPIGINDNFFVLGGQSLLATKIIAIISRNFRLEIPLKYLFQFPTIRELGELISYFYISESMKNFSDNKNREIGEI
jgi:acyl-coenzyme A synthetase/AMP-(fatty) acid ligase/acyl carrier protein